MTKIKDNNRGPQHIRLTITPKKGADLTAPCKIPGLHVLVNGHRSQIVSYWSKVVLAEKLGSQWRVAVAPKAKDGEPTLGTVLGAEVRARCNSLTEQERELYRRIGMSIIHGGRRVLVFSASSLRVRGTMDEALAEAANGGTVLITLRGKPAAYLVRYDGPRLPAVSSAARRPHPVASKAAGR
jgi:antitoxin (DNA-binding transcriptional repressor) of toxin-antitoxin stability system